MEILVRRQVFTNLSTIGEMLIDGQHECWTLEPVWLENSQVKPRAIGEGRYQLKSRCSKEHKCNVPGVENVPGFSDVEIHWGNFPKDTKGCTLVGQTKGPQPDYIGRSELAFEALWTKLLQASNRGEEVWITYENSPRDGQ